MKVTYEFDPYEDKEDLEMFKQGKKCYLALWEFSNNVKSRTRELEGKELDGYELAMKHFYEVLDNYDINF